MALGGVAELCFGVKAEGEQLEDIAKPLTVEDGESGGPDEQDQDAPDSRNLADGARREAAPARAAHHEAWAALHEEGARRHVSDADGDDDGARGHEQRARERERLLRRQQREREGLRRLRPGPGSNLYSPRMVGTGAASRGLIDAELDREIEIIGRVLDEHGEMSRRELARLAGARYWGPGRFPAALREAIDAGRARRLSRTTVAPAHDDRPGAR
jgi:hypothetical protein